MVAEGGANGRLGPKGVRAPNAVRPRSAGLRGTTGGKGDVTGATSSTAAAMKLGTTAGGGGEEDFDGDDGARTAGLTIAGGAAGATGATGATGADAPAIAACRVTNAFE